MYKRDYKFYSVIVRTVFFVPSKLSRLFGSFSDLSKLIEPRIEQLICFSHIHRTSALLFLSLIFLLKSVATVCSSDAYLILTNIGISIYTVKAATVNFNDYNQFFSIISNISTSQ